MASHIGSNPDVNRVPEFGALDTPPSRRPRRLMRRCGIGAMCAATAALVAITPAAALASSTSGAAGEGPATAAVTSATQPAPGELLSSSRIEELLAGLPLGDLSAAQLAHSLAEFENIGVFAQLHVGLLGEELGVAGLENSLTKAIEQLGPSATIGELVETTGLLPNLEGELNGLLGKILGSSLGTEQQEELAEGLHAVSLDQLLSTLLAAAHEPQQLGGLAKVAEGLFEELGSNATEGLLGAPLEAPFTPTTVEGAAEELGTTTKAVSEELGQTTTTLPADATMLTTPIKEGKLLAVAPAVKGLALGLLNGASEEEGAAGEEEKSGTETGGGGKGSQEGAGEEAGPSGSGQGTGGQGGSGGNATPGAGGSGGSNGPLTVVVNVPRNTTPSTSATAPNTAKAAAVRILSTSVKGHKATIVLQAPAAGRLQLRGSGIKSKTITVSKAGRVTVHVSLTKAGTASLHRRHGRLKVKLHASFKVSSGTTSTATRTITFR